MSLIQNLRTKSEFFSKNLMALGFQVDLCVLICVRASVWTRRRIPATPMLTRYRNQLEKKRGRRSLFGLHIFYTLFTHIDLLVVSIYFLIIFLFHIHHILKVLLCFLHKIIRNNLLSKHKTAISCFGNNFTFWFSFNLALDWVVTFLLEKSRTNWVENLSWTTKFE